ncbi:hypothetical protein QCA50_008238 [Cerrena zonata]|uniref:Uncharacterized protein n=1 Tax=Cerrena zonata TaxID=2478898 RepID=A0AAW0GC17_9APHY
MMKSIWKSDPGTRVVACDLDNLVTLRLQHETDVREIIYSHGPMPDLVHTRVILAGFMIFPIIATRYIWWSVRDEDEVDYGIGPILPPEYTPLLPDNVIFTRYWRHSDFDYPFLHQSEEHWAQFLRWKTHMVETVKSQPVFAGDVLLGKTNKFAQRNPLLRPYYPAILPPRPTMQTFENCHRPDPLRQFSSRLTQSSSFTVRILRELTES